MGSCKNMAVIQGVLFLYLYSILILQDVHGIYLRSGNQFRRGSQTRPQISSAAIIGTNSRNAHPAEALCEGALEMFAYDGLNQEHAINIGQNNDGRFPYGYRKIMPNKDFLPILSLLRLMGIAVGSFLLDIGIEGMLKYCNLEK